MSNALRHPLDPEPVPATKATAVFVLGLVGAVTGFFLGGLIPASIALMLAKQAGPEMAGAGGFLTGARALRVGVRLAWVGVLLGAAAIVTATVLGLLHLATSTPTAHFGPSVD